MMKMDIVASIGDLSGIKMFMLKMDMLHRYEFFLELQCS